MTFDFQKMVQTVADFSQERHEPTWLLQKRQTGLQALQ